MCILLFLTGTSHIALSLSSHECNNIVHYILVVSADESHSYQNLLWSWQSENSRHQAQVLICQGYGMVLIEKLSGIACHPPLVDTQWICQLDCYLTPNTIAGNCSEIFLKVNAFYLWSVICSSAYRRACVLYIFLYKTL